MMLNVTSVKLESVCSFRSKRSATISLRSPLELVRVLSAPSLPLLTPLLLCSFNWASAPLPKAVETVKVGGSTARTEAESSNGTAVAKQRLRAFMGED